MAEGNREAPALSGILRWLPFAIAAAVVVLDRVTKVYIRAHFSAYDSVSIIPGLFRIVHTENPGAAFGMLAEGNAMVRSIVLVGISAAVLVFVVAALLKRSNPMGGTASRLALGFILGGAIGNLFDRVALGTVTDCLEIYNGGWTFPAFNIADSAITVGAALLLIDMLWPRHKRMAHHPLQPPAEF